MKYAGIGSRQTPHIILDEMILIAKQLAQKGHILRSGGADGADTAFESGCDLVNGKKEIYLPWKGFNGNNSDLYSIKVQALLLAEKFHPRWDKLNQAAQKLMARNCYQVLGYNLDDPVDFIVCWTKDGKASGGTGQAIRIANYYKIPVYNLYNKSDIDKLNEILKKD